MRYLINQSQEDFTRPVCLHMGFCTLYKSLHLELIKEKLTGLTESTFQREGSSYFALNDRNAIFTSDDQNRFKCESCKTHVTRYRTF